MSKVLFIGVFSLFLINCANANSLNVKYAGFAFCGNFKDIPLNFKYSSALADSTKDRNKRTIFDREFLMFFIDNKSSISNFNLLMGEDSDTKISMAIAVTRESISVVNIEDVYKIVVNLCCNVIFLNFDGMKVMASYPLYLEYIDVKKNVPTEKYKMDLLKRLYFSKDFSILKILKEKLSSLKLKNDAKLSLKVMNVYFEDEAKDKLGIYRNNLGAFGSIIAHKFSDFLSNKLNVSVLPYARDYIGSRMSLVFSDARMQDFEIPPASYGIDFTLRKLTKKLYKKGVGEDAYLYGAYITVRVYDPDLGTQYWDKKSKYGAVKKIPRLQKTIDNFSIYDEMIAITMLKGIKEMQNDKQFYKEVIERCLNK